MKRTLWMLLDDRRGSVGQARGIALAIGDKLNIIEKQIVYNSLGWIPNWIKGRSLMGVNIAQSSPLTAPYPDMVLSTSRRTVAAARWIRKMSGNRTKIIQLMYPSGGIGLKDMELVAVPSHDNPRKLKGSNILVITGASHQIFPDKLEAARQYWTPKFDSLPKPWTAVIIGGAIKGKPWPLDNAEALADLLSQIHKQTGGSLLLTTSRRTGKEAEKIILEKLKTIPMYTYIWGETKENPLMGFYACSDLIVVTADSVSMCSESCAAGKPVLLFRGRNWLPAKHQRFAQSLIDQEYACDITAPNALSFHPSRPLNSAELIAEKILEIS